MNRWLKFLMLYLGGTLIGMSQLKIAPIIDPLSQYLNTSLTQMSLLTSIFTISGIFIAIPGGILLTQLGVKKMLLIVIGLLAVGNFIGIGTNSFMLLLVSRIIEGISFSTIVMIGVVLINFWFKDSPNLGTAIGLFTTFPAAASLIAMNFFLPMSEKFGIFFSWYFIGGGALGLFILYLFLIDGPVKKAPHEQTGTVKSLFFKATKNKNMWILGLLQGCMAFVLYAYIALYPVLFSNYYELSQTTANFYSGLFGLFGIPFGVVAGYLIDKTKNPGQVILSAFLLMTFACLAAPFLGGRNLPIIIQVFSLSAAAMISSSSITIMVPKVAENDDLVAYSMSFINLFYYTSIVVGAPFISSLIEKFSWLSGLLVLTAIAMVGVLGSILYIKSTKTSIQLNQSFEGEK